MLVWLASYPRSGNTLVRQVLESALGAPTYTVYQGEDACGLPDAVYDGVDTPDLHFVKTHKTDAETVASSYPAICIVRDGRDALVSHAHFEAVFSPNNKGRPVATLLRELVDGEGKWHWAQHIQAWHERAAPYVTVRFEELVQEPEGNVRTACRLLGVTLPPGEIHLPGFEELHASEPEFYRSGKVGQWREWFDDELHEQFWRLHGYAMEHLGYKRESEALCLRASA